MLQIMKNHHLTRISLQKIQGSEKIKNMKNEAEKNILVIDELQN